MLKITIILLILHLILYVFCSCNFFILVCVKQCAWIYIWYALKSLSDNPVWYVRPLIHSQGNCRVNVNKYCFLTCTGILSCGNDDDQLAKRSSQSPNIHNIMRPRIWCYKLSVYFAFCTSSFQRDRHHKDSKHFSVWVVLLSKCDTYPTDTVYDNLMYAGQIESVWQLSTLVIFATSIPFFLFPPPPF